MFLLVDMDGRDQDLYMDTKYNIIRPLIIEKNATTPPPYVKKKGKKETKENEKKKAWLDRG